MMTEEVVTFGLWFSPRRLSRLGPYNFSDPLEIQMALLEPFVDKIIEVLTNDGRCIVGFLRGFDQSINVIVENSHERVYSQNGVEQVTLGLYVIRGDNIAVVGLVDEEKDKAQDFSKVKADPLRPVVH